MSLILALLLSLPLLNDVARKYVWFTDVAFILTAAVAAAGATWAVPRIVSLHHRIAPVYILGLLYLAVGGTATLLRPEATNGAYFVGTYLLVIPVLFFITAHGLSKKVDDPVWLAAKLLTCWSTAILAVAAAQLILGPQHEINRLPGQLGRGVYAYSGGEFVAGVFRPASIFLHTGKLGQVALTLAFFKLAILIERSALPWWFLPSVLIDVAILVVSGQRMAWILVLLLSLGVLIGAPIGRKSRLAWLAVLLLGTGWIGWQAGGEDLFSAMGGRVVHTLETAGDRLYLNVLQPFGAVLQTAGFLGVGLGMFTTGSSAFGGQRLYFAVTEGVPEGTWYRVLGETGLPGLAMFFFMLVILLTVMFKSYREKVPRRAPAALFFIWWLGAMAAWGIFHDVFANSTTLALAFTLGGLGASSRFSGSE